MIQRIGYIIVLLCIGLSAHGTEITGFAPSFVGKTVKLYTYSDYLTMTKVELATGSVSAKDSTFRLSTDVKQVIKVLIEIENTNADIYLGPNTNYEIYYKLDENYAQSFGSQKATTYFKNLDTADINYKILQYQNWFDEYLYVNQSNILSKGIAPYIDTFKRYAYEAYAQESNPYFVNFVRYNIGTLEKLKVTAKYRKTKLALYLEYIQPYPVYAFNDQYMNYLRAFYGNDFSTFANQIQSDIVLAIHHASPSRLMSAMHRDQFFEKNEIRELIMVNMLGNAYHNNQYNKENVKVMLDSIVKFAKFQSSGLAAGNILKELVKVAPGYPAPNFNIQFNEDSIALSDYKNRFVFVNFFANWNMGSVRDMKIMEELVAKYSEHITFISFCTDENIAEFEAFKKENPSMKWPIVYIGNKHQILRDYQAASLPYYVLIDQYGVISSAPALGPSPDGVNRTIEATFKFIKTEMERRD